MPLKSRTESKEFRIMKSLNGRMQLSSDDKQHYLNLKKGYEGEVKFDSLTASLDSKFYILNDLLLKSNNTTFQIDSLLITQALIILCEVKNYEGDYYYKDDGFYMCTNSKEITNPLHQLHRSETLLRQLLQKQGFNLPIDGNLIFIHPEFFLYQAPQNKQIIFSPQLPSFMKNLSAKPSNLNGNQRKIADFLLSAHITDSPYTQVPTYEYGGLRKGCKCGVCDSFDVICGERKIRCMNCGSEETIELAVLRSTEEFILLFPKQRITTNMIHDWCKVVKYKKRIRNILLTRYILVGHGKYSYFETTK
ncbi:nuclease-related domain-containing protein [Neobacillus sp. FSL H8-0543]|uniref:nuclease-related domain-containing protein n=1 Tax=Neobacillus sp. FSL H8-0543 TaxID=2954672 RepID=UPI003158E34B